MNASMPSKVFTAAIADLDAQLIEVEIAGFRGLRTFEIVGLPDKTVQESKERINSAVRSSGFLPPFHTNLRLIVNLAPADLKKEGSLYDLPIALGFLLESEQTNFDPLDKISIGELGLDGKIKPVKGVVSIAILAKKLGIKEIILPKENALEAKLVLGREKTPKIIGVSDLKETIGYLEGKKEIVEPKSFSRSLLKEDSTADFCWIKGQEHAKRALEICSAGGHHLTMTGPPGGGKTILAKSIISILPKLEKEEALEVTRIYSIAGLLDPEKPLITSRPFRAPHHTASEAALIGGGNPPRPGEITLAHRGVLFLDEFPEFHRDVLESLRQPIEEGEITILRARHCLKLPSRFILIAASNPCPCGFYQDSQRECRCTSSQIAKYQRKLSGPLADRIDIFVDVPQIKYEKLADNQMIGESKAMRQRVEKARLTQRIRFSKQKGKKKVFTNAEMDLTLIKKICELDSQSHILLKRFVDSSKLSARGYHRVLKVARTIADLEESKKILFEHVSEALNYRLRDV